MKSTKITNLHAREVLDSRGNPTVQTMIWAGDTWSLAAVPSGASTGSHEAFELRDGDKKRYNGLGVQKAVRNVNGKILEALKGVEAGNQRKVDEMMLGLDGTDDKHKLGANAILSVSLAAARLAARAKGQELYQHLQELSETEKIAMPRGLFNVINGGRHADSGLDVQEFFLIPQDKNFHDQVQKTSEVYHALKNNLIKQGLSAGVGDEGGFAPKLKHTEAALSELRKAVKIAGYKEGKDFNFGMDVASSEFYQNKKYHPKAGPKSASSIDLVKVYKQLLNKYPLEVLEDGMAEDDFIGWKLLTQELGSKLKLVGDDLFVTNSARIQSGVTQKMANAVLIKPNQIGTLTETLEAIKLAKKYRYGIVVSHRSGETNDSFIADLAVGVAADYIKAGAPARSERVAKYNRLMAIEEILKS